MSGVGVPIASAGEAIIMKAKKDGGGDVIHRRQKLMTTIDDTRDAIPVPKTKPTPTLTLERRRFRAANINPPDKPTLVHVHAHDLATGKEDTRTNVQMYHGKRRRKIKMPAQPILKASLAPLPFPNQSRKSSPPEDRAPARLPPPQPPPTP